MTTADEKRPVFNILQTCQAPLSLHMGEVIGWQDYIAERGLIPNPETGDTKIGVRLIIVTKDERSYFTTAISIIAAIDRIMTFWGPGPYDPALPFSITQGRTARGRNWYQVDLM